jgi:abortive infection bacteriophage resistance protein
VSNAGTIFYKGLGMENKKPIMEVKKPTTYQEQLEILRNRGCRIDDEQRAIQFLKRTSYYRFSGYLVAFRQSYGNYFEGLIFDRVASIYVFDQELRVLITKAVSEMEISIKSTVAYHHGHTYGSLGYTNPDTFIEKHDHDRFTEKFETAVQNNSNSLIVRHHKRRYNGQFPIWAATELFTMSMISIFYADLKTKDKKAIAADYATDYVHLESWLHSVSVLRNICAHHSRLYNIKFHQNPKLPRRYTKIENVGAYSLFKQISVLKLLHANRKEDWNNAFVLPIAALLEKYGDAVELGSMGFPVNWEDVLMW